MPDSSLNTVDIRTRADWRKWLDHNHASTTDIWLIFHKAHTGIEVIPYNDAVEEALCFGWIDSLIRRLDDDRYARKFTPRKTDSKWSTANRQRYASVKKKGLLTPAGEARPPTDRGGDAPAVSATDVPTCIEKALKADKKAWAFFQALAPSYRKTYIGYIDSAKRQETKDRRLEEVRTRLASHQKPGLK